MGSEAEGCGAQGVSGLGLLEGAEIMEFGVCKFAGVCLPWMPAQGRPQDVLNRAASGPCCWVGFLSSAARA